MCIARKLERATARAAGRIALGAGLTLATAASALAGCADRPDTLGVSRTIVVDPTDHARIGTMQYGETLPLQDREVVLTFDDGPLPPYTPRILETLASECVKATFFVVGRMATAYPQMVRDVQAAGHTIGTHTQNHPFAFGHLPPERIAQEIDGGIASVTAALGDPAKLAPFFRIPGLVRSTQAEAALEARGLMNWSADFPADDWRHISAEAVERIALSRLEAKGKGILLLHDIQPATALALPHLLRELKTRGYRIVQVVPATTDRPKTVADPVQWLLHPVEKTPTASAWPRVRGLTTAMRDSETPVLGLADVGVLDFAGQILGDTTSATQRRDRWRQSGRSGPAWPRITATGAAMTELPIPAAILFEIPVGSMRHTPISQAPRTHSWLRRPLPPKDSSRAKQVVSDQPYLSRPVTAEATFPNGG